VLNDSFELLLRAPQKPANDPEKARPPESLFEINNAILREKDKKL
jgi:hypothetical protein